MSGGPLGGRPTDGIGGRLREARTARGWSLAIAARNTGLEISSLGAYERGDRGLFIDKAKAIADVYGVPVGWLFGDDTPAAKTGRVILNLGAVDDGADRDDQSRALWRWTESIRQQRGDRAGRVLSIRADDLFAVSQVVELPHGDVLPWLAATGLLADGSLRPVSR